MDNSNILYGPINESIASFLKDKKYTKIAILVDENTKKLCLPLIHLEQAILIEIESGEVNKNLSTCSHIWSRLLAHNFDRQSLMINLGGGVITDMGGFAASCYKRGLDFIHIPTTLLAMVDASVGAKTAVDFELQKNMIGLFSPAKAVMIDPGFLKTLDPRQILSGKAEMLKHGLIADEKHFKAVLKSDIPSLELIQDSIRIKDTIVQEDPMEIGLRKSLNFGHTLGHALESLFLSQGRDILHGEAVAQGMIWALKLSMKFCNFDEQKAQDIIADLEAIYGSINVSKEEALKMISLAKNDKKNQDGKISYCLLENTSRVNISIAVEGKAILGILCV